MRENGFSKMEPKISKKFVFVFSDNYNKKDKKY